MYKESLPKVFFKGISLEAQIGKKCLFFQKNLIIQSSFEYFSQENSLLGSVYLGDFCNSSCYNYLFFVLKLYLIECQNRTKHVVISSVSDYLYTHSFIQKLSLKTTTGGALTACPSGATEFTPDFSVVLVAPSLVLLCSILSFCPFFLFTVVLFVLRIIASD